MFDICHGSSSSDNAYNYKEVPNVEPRCMDVRGDNVFLGVALDGFPIYYDKRADRSSLDECSGKFVDRDKREYRYFITNEYPYTIGCFRGKVPNMESLTECSGTLLDSLYYIRKTKHWEPSI